MKIMLLQIVINYYLSFLSHLVVMFPGETSPEGRHEPNYMLSMKLIEGEQLFRLHCAHLISFVL